MLAVNPLFMRDFLIFWRMSPHFRGAIWKITAFLFFSIIAGIVRYLSQTTQAMGHAPLPAFELAFFQSFLGFIFMIPWIIHNGSSALRTRHPLLQTSRILLYALGVVFFYSALSYIPLSQAVALMFLGPLFTTLGARIFLKEKLSGERSLAILIGFIGGLIVQTTFLDTSLGLYACLPFLAALCFSGDVLLVRRLVQEDSPHLVVTYLLVFIAPLLLIPTLLYGAWPEPWQWPWLFAMGGCAASAHLCLGKAFTCAEVTYLTPFVFTKWFASTLIGFVAFAEVPSLWTCIGAFILMGSIIMLSYRGARQST